MAEQKSADKAEETETNQDGTAPLQAGVDPKTVTEDAPNGVTAGYSVADNAGQRTIPVAQAVDYDAETDGERADAERLHNASVSPEGDAEIVKAGDSLSDSLFAGEGDFVTLTKDVVEEFYFPDTTRPSHKLLFSKGQVVRRSDIEALNARIEATRAVAGGADEAEPEPEPAAEPEPDGADGDEGPAEKKSTTRSRAKSK